jgi:transcriptional antiterminator RfaH
MIYNNAMKNWYLIQTKPQQESLAAQNLTNQNYEVFFPKTLIKDKTIPLFPRYLFIQLDKQAQNWSPIRSTKGVANFVRFGLNFAKVPEQIILSIKAQEAQTGEKIITLNSHQKGDALEIKSGVFQGQQAIFKNYNRNDRIIVLLNLIGQQQEIELKEGEVATI